MKDHVADYLEAKASKIHLGSFILGILLATTAFTAVEVTLYCMGLLHIGIKP